MDRNDFDWDRLDRYVTGSGSPEQLAALERWIDSDPELRALADSMRTIGRPPEAAAGEWDVRAAYDGLHRRMRLVGRPQLRVHSATGGKTQSRSERPERPRRRRANVWPSLAAAAVAFFVIGSAVVIARLGRPAPEDAAVAVEIHEFTTGRRQRSIVDLPDGSRVILAPETRLRIPDTYTVHGRGPRDLFLEGQAHFQVEYDSARPFKVYAANGIAEDLGTEFVVTAYPETDGMEVVVASGTVALHARQSPGEVAAADSAARSRPLMTLTEGDLVRLDSGGAATVTHGIDVTARTAWTQGMIVFDGILLGDAIPVLERWYDIEIHLADRSLVNRRLTTTFGAEPLPQLLELLGMSLGLRVDHVGRSVTLSPTHPQRPR